MDQVVPGAMLCMEAQKLVGHIPVPKEERRVKGEPLLELQTVVAVVEDRIIGEEEPVRFKGKLVGPELRRRPITSSEGSQMTSDNCVGRPVGWLGSSLNLRRRAAKKLVTPSVYETLSSATADHSAMTRCARQTGAENPR